jgi:dihydropteroate synthase
MVSVGALMGLCFFLMATGLLIAVAHTQFATWEACGRVLTRGERPLVMGIVNVTPDSFSDGGRALALENALALARHHVSEGADLLDIGGESSRPGAASVPLEEELRRVVPAVEALAAATETPISLDTTKAEVARRALAAGAVIVNDITALAGDREMTRVVLQSGAGVVLMHMQGDPSTMQANPTYDDVVTEVYDFLAHRIEGLEAEGIPRARMAIDPGIGFGKTFQHNLDLLQNLDRFGSLGCTVLLGTSRKGFLGTITGRPVGERATASVVSSLFGVFHGVGVVRVHDVGPMVDAIKVWQALESRDQRS